MNEELLQSYNKCSTISISTQYLHDNFTFRFHLLTRNLLFKTLCSNL